MRYVPAWRKRTGLSEVREQSIRVATALGYQAPPVHFPLLDGDLAPRATSDVVRRTGVLSAVAAVAHGCPVGVVDTWLIEEGLDDMVTTEERRYLVRPDHSPTDEEAGRPEAIYTLACAASLVPVLDFAHGCPDDLIDKVPHPPGKKAPIPVRTILGQASPRGSRELLAALDLAYCLHWAVTEAAVGSAPPPGRVPPWVVVERHRALEWVLGSDDWDDISLDT